MTDDKLAAFLADLEAKAAAATPGPWWPVHGDDRRATNMRWVSMDRPLDHYYYPSGIDPSRTICVTYHQSDPVIASRRRLRGPDGELADDPEWESKWNNHEYIASLPPEVVRALVAVAKAAARCVDLSQPETQAMRHDLEEAGKVAHAAIEELRRIAEAR